MLVTHGAGGMTVIDRMGDYHHQPAKSGPVVDVTGAGDTVLAVVAYLRSIGVGWPGVLDMAATGAAAVCARHGTSTVTRPDLPADVEQVPAADQIGGDVGARIVDAVAHAGLGGEVFRDFLQR